MYKHKHIYLYENDYVNDLLFQKGRTFYLVFFSQVMLFNGKEQ